MKNKKQIEAYKKILKALMVGTLACTTVGCAGSENEPAQGNEQTNEVENQQPREDYLPQDNMSKEDTKKLEEGNEFSAEEFTQFPDEITLEEQGLALGYVYHVQTKTVNTDGSSLEDTYTITLGTQEPIYKEIPDGITGATYQLTHTLTSVQICKITNYVQDEDGTWYKNILEGDNETFAGPVLSQKVIKELNGKQKTK